MGCEKGSYLYSPMAKLLLEINHGHNVKPGEKIPLGPVTKIGRHFDNDIVVSCSTISRHHCEILLEGQEWMLKDLGSRNGTTLNRARITKIILENDDVIGLADSHFVFRFIADNREDILDTLNQLDSGTAGEQSL